jgi:hypothetical protein
MAAPNNATRRGMTMNISTLEKTVASNGNMVRLIAISGDFQLSHYVVEVRINHEFKMVGRYEPSQYDVAKDSYDWRAECITRCANQAH